MTVTLHVKYRSGRYEKYFINEDYAQRLIDYNRKPTYIMFNELTEKYAVGIKQIVTCIYPDEIEWFKIFYTEDEENDETS